MHTFHLPDMSSSHCNSMVKVGLKLVDRTCEIQAYLPGQLVSVKSSEGRESLVKALADAGYRHALASS